jgi:hypothetical protein
VLNLDETTFSEDTGTNPALGTPTTIANSFLDIGSALHEEADAVHENDVTDKLQSSDRDINPAGFTFDELIQRLLAQPISKADSRFVSVFLCLYRKFAAPARLLSALLYHFERLSQNHEPQVLRIGSQLRYLSIIAQWTTTYPGDFAHPVTWSYMDKFVKKISQNHLFTAAASEMREQLDNVHDDDDTQWLCSDIEKGHPDTLQYFTIVPSLRSTVLPSTTQSHEVEGINLTSTVLAVPEHQIAQSGHTKTSSSVSSLGPLDHPPSPSSTKVLNSLDSIKQQAETLIPTSKNILSKPQWHQFMDFSDDDIARELTRIDWIMYSAMKPRDLIRHVSLTPEQKMRCKSLQHVNRMINQFNHVAFWVGNMILLRDKAKHRAKALEKFMGIAWVWLSSR